MLSSLSWSSKPKPMIGPPWTMPQSDLDCLRKTLVPQCV